MSAGELVVSGENEPVVALGMTSASFDSAQRSDVIRIEADTDAMKYIARQIGVEVLSPLVIVTRDSSDTRKLIGRWDDRLPMHRGNPNTGRFFPANRLDQPMPPSVNRESLVEIAKSISAPALTEVSVASWEPGVSHAGDFAAGLLLGQRPLDLPPKPSRLAAVGNFFTPTSNQTLAAIDAVRANPKMPDAFIVVRRPLKAAGDLEQ